MDTSSLHDLAKLKDLLKKSSLTETEQAVFIKKIEEQGYLDEDTRQDLIDILQLENQVIESALEESSPKAIDDLKAELDEVNKLEDELVDFEAGKQDFFDNQENYKAELKEIEESTGDNEARAEQVKELNEKYGMGE